MLANVNLIIHAVAKQKTSFHFAFERFYIKYEANKRI